MASHTCFLVFLAWIHDSYHLLATHDTHHPCTSRSTVKLIRSMSLKVNQASGKLLQTNVYEFDLDFVILADMAWKPILLCSVLFTSSATWTVMQLPGASGSYTENDVNTNLSGIWEKFTTLKAQSPLISSNRQCAYKKRPCCPVCTSPRWWALWNTREADLYVSIFSQMDWQWTVRFAC